MKEIQQLKNKLGYLLHFLEDEDIIDYDEKVRMQIKKEKKEVWELIKQLEEKNNE